MVAVTPAAMQALSAIRPAGVASGVRVFGLSESQIARRVKVIAKAAGLAHWQFFSAHPRDRTPGPVEARQRHGRLLHSRGDRRVDAQVLVSCTRLWNGLQKPAGICVSFRMLAETMSGSSRHVSLRSLGSPTLRDGGR